MTVVPSKPSLSAVLVDGQPRNAAPVANNDSALQDAANALIDCLSGGVAGQVLTAVDGSHVEWADAATSVPVYTFATLPAANTAGVKVLVADSINGVKGVWPFEYDSAGDATYPYKIVGDDGTGGVVAAPRDVVFAEATPVVGAVPAAVGSFVLPFAGRVIFGAVGHTNGGTVTVRFGSTATGNDYASLTGASGNLGEAAAVIIAAAGSTIYISKNTSSGSFSSQLSAEYLRPVRVKGQA